jgi:outer membrane protein insertion porin family
MKTVWTLLLIVLCAGLFAQDDMIAKITVRGNSNVEEGLILSVIPLRIGDFVQSDHVSTALQNLYKLGVFRNVSILSQPFEEGVELIVEVEENPVITDVKIKGNRKISRSRIEELIELKPGSYLSDFVKMEITQKIRDEYIKKGYHQTTVTFDEKSDGPNRVQLILRIEDGPKTVIRKIEIIGNENIPTRKLLGKMKTKKAGLLRSGIFDEEKYRADLDYLVSYYKKQGYIDARVVSQSDSVVDGKFLRIRIELFEGNQYHFGEVTADGNKRFTNEAILANFHFKQHEVFDQEKFDTQLQEVQGMYFEEGYIYAQFDQTLIKDGDLLNIQLKIQENTRARIHQIHFTGNRRTREKVIRRQLDINPGDYFKRSKVVQSQRNIYNLGYFDQNIELNPEPINQEGDVDLTIKVADKVSGSVNGGVGYNSSDKFVGQFSLSQNNLFGKAWRTSLSWEFGGSYQDFEYSFTNPYTFDSSVLTGFNVNHTLKEWSSYNYKVYTNGGGVQAGFDTSFLNRASLLFGYSLSSKKYRIIDDDDDASTYVTQLDSVGWQQNSCMSATFSRDSRDNVYFPTMGSQFTLYEEVAGGPFGGDFDYYKEIVELKWYIQTFSKFVLKTKWRVGFVSPYGKSDEVPPEERFYLGGTGSDGIRGYADRSVGPDDGGHREVLFSTEYAYPIAGDQIVGLTFFDAGNSYDELGDFNLWELKKGAGLGIRIMSPFGLLGFDYAYNFEKRSWEPHFQFGTSF